MFASTNKTLIVVFLVILGLALAGVPFQIQAQSTIKEESHNLPAGLEKSVKAALEPNYRLPNFPNTQQAKLVQPTPAQGDVFGYRVALSADGNTALIGMPGAITNNQPSAGKALTFVRIGTTWTLQASLNASDAGSGDGFGERLALSADGNTAAVAAPYRNDSPTVDNGAVYIFYRSGTTWVQQAKLAASDKATNDWLGYSVSISADGNIVLAGAPFGDDSGLTDNGVTYVFTRSGTVWTQQVKLLATDKTNGDSFGFSVALSGDGLNAIIGAAGKSDTGTQYNGASYVFTRSGNVWTQQAKLLAFDKATYDNFGSSVSMSNDGSTALIGAWRKGDEGPTESGATYVFVRDGSTWQQQEKIVLPDSSYYDQFGYTVSLSADGNSALISAIGKSEPGLSKNGAAYLYSRNGTTWGQQAKLLAADRANYDYFGLSAISADGSTALVGAYNKNNASGAAYVFVQGIGSTPTPTPTNTPVPLRPDTIGAYKNGVFYLRNANTNGGADLTAFFGGDASDLPVAGDWNGDSVDTIGVYRNSTGFFFLSDSNTAPAVNYTVLFGNPGDTPFAGKWTADMTHDGIGVYRNSNGILYQRKSLTSGFDDFFAVFGNPGDQGVAGDWDGNGFDSIGIYRSSNQTWYLTNNSTPSGITFSDINFVWDITTSAPVVGDWDGDGDSTVGYLTASGVFVLHPNNATAGTDNVFAFGPANSKPIAGKWVAGSKPPLGSVVKPITSNQPGSNVNSGNGD